MRRPRATLVTHLLQRGRRPRTINPTNPNSSVSVPSAKKNRSRPASIPSPLCQLVERPCFSSWITYKTKTRHTQLRCSHKCLSLIRHTSTLDFQHQQWATTAPWHAKDSAKLRVSVLSKLQCVPHSLPASPTKSSNSVCVPQTPTPCADALVCQ